jgi:S1-C subfamily serine protease
MAEIADPITDPLALLSERTAALVERTAENVVAVQGGRRSTSGIHWRAGVIVTAEEALERDDDIAVALPDGRQVSATLAGRDPTTDVAVLRFQPDGLPVAALGDAAPLRPGHWVIAVGRHRAGAIASQGIVSIAGPAWQSLQGGTIDRLIRLDLSLSLGSEGGAVIDTGGRVLGMAVLGPRRRVLAIPTSTIDRAVERLLAKGHVARAYLGASLEAVRLAGAPSEKRGVLVVGLDPEGPAAGAGLLVGDIVTQWNGASVSRVRDIWRALGSESIGTAVTLTLLRGGKPETAQLTLGERPVS